MDTALELFIENERVAQVVDGGLERSAFLTIRLRGRLALFIDLWEVIPQLIKCAVAFVLLGHAKHAKDFLVGHGEHRIGIRHFPVK